MDQKVHAEARIPAFRIQPTLFLNPLGLLALLAVPGKNMVPVDWWREQLDVFELVAINPVEPVS